MTTAAVEETPTTEISPAATLPATSADGLPVHLAKCAECASAVRFRPSASGASFILVDADPDATFGIGEHGRPLCPNGHGEMSIADDQLKPVPEAFADAQTMLQRAEGEATGPVQRTLPGVGPVFNFQGCYMELEKQAVLVCSLKKSYDEDARVARESKKAWDEAEEKLTALAMTFRLRRQSKDEAVVDETDTGARSPRLVKCTYEAKHPDEPCPICGGDYVAPSVLEQYLGNPSAIAPADAEAHVADVEKFLVGLESDETVQALEGLNTFVPFAVVTGWTPEERKAVTLYCDQQLDIKNDVIEPGVERLARPTVLGTPHIPEKANDDAGPQRCSICNAVLPREKDCDPFEVTDFVGVDCIGKAKAEGHRYPEKGKKKSAAKGATKKATK